MNPVTTTWRVTGFIVYIVHGVPLSLEEINLHAVVQPPTFHYIAGSHWAFVAKAGEC